MAVVIKLFCASFRCQDIKHNDTSLDDTVHKDAIHRDTSHHGTRNNGTQPIVQKRNSASDTQSTKTFHIGSIEYRYYVECHYFQSRYAECRGVVIICFTTLSSLPQGATTLSITTFSIMTLHKDTQHSNTQHNDTQHNDTQHNNTQHNDTQHNDTQHNDTQHKRLLCDSQHYNTLQYLSRFFNSYAECCTECSYAAFCGACLSTGKHYYHTLIGANTFCQLGILSITKKIRFSLYDFILP